MIRLVECDAGVILPVRAHAGARSTAIRGSHAGALRVAVTAAPEKGKANRAIIELLCRHLALHRSQIELYSGESSPDKRFLVRGILRDDLESRLEPFVG